MAEEKKETTPATSTAPEAPKKKSNVALIIIIVVVVILALGVGSCYMAGCYLGNKVKNISQNGLSIDTPEGQMQVNTSETSNLSWPKEITSDIPEFKAGKIEGTSHVSQIWTVIYSNISDSDINSYKDSLNKNGWKIEGEVDAGIAKSFSATKGIYQISLSYSSSEKSAVLGINLDINATQ